MSAAAIAALLGGHPAHAFITANTVTTTLRVTVCGDGLTTGVEVCDYGPGNNNGGYSTSTANRTCNSDCESYGPYCGDTVLQPTFGEGCDDGNNTSGDRCSNVCIVEDLPSGGSGGGGGGGGGFPGGGFIPPGDTKIVVEGKAYPNASVHILKDGNTIGVVEADGDADFYFTTQNIVAGVTTLGFWAEDSSGLKSIALTTTLTLVSGAVTTISGAYIPPTITLDKRSLRQGETLTMSGETAPSVTVATYVNSSHEIISETESDGSGAWELAFDTSPLTNNELHSAKALFQLPIGGSLQKSAFSQAVSFFIGEGDAANRLLADLNGDGKINLVDFSILLFHWGSAGPIGDINGDGRVSLTDFSILLFNWTG